jgi:hypothetical protein
MPAPVGRAEETSAASRMLEGVGDGALTTEELDPAVTSRDTTDGLSLTGVGASDVSVETAGVDRKEKELVAAVGVSCSISASEVHASPESPAADWSPATSEGDGIKKLNPDDKVTGGGAAVSTAGGSGAAPADVVSCVMNENPLEAMTVSLADAGAGAEFKNEKDDTIAAGGSEVPVNAFKNPNPLLEEAADAALSSFSSLFDLMSNPPNMIATSVLCLWEKIRCCRRAKLWNKT